MGVNIYISECYLVLYSHFIIITFIFFRSSYTVCRSNRSTAHRKLRLCKMYTIQGESFRPISSNKVKRKLILQSAINETAVTSTLTYVYVEWTLKGSWCNNCEKVYANSLILFISSINYKLKDVSWNKPTVYINKQKIKKKIR